MKSVHFQGPSFAAGDPVERGRVSARGREEGAIAGLVLDSRDRLALPAGRNARATGSFISAVTDLGTEASIRVDWVAQWTAPQRWEKYPGNPVLTPKQTGAWDNWCNGVSVVRNPDQRSYKMFYAGRKGAGIGFAEALIKDPVTWKEHPASPVLKPRDDNWEGNQINQPRVVKVTDTHWRMYYTGWGLAAKGSAWAIGLAESFDAGISWQRVSDKSLLDRGAPGTPDDGGVFVPEVRQIGGRWYAWYTAMKQNGDKQNIHLCLATSADGLRWEKHPGNPVLSDDFSSGPARNVISRCHVRYDHGVFQMWYSHARPDYRIRYAESLDGIHWEKSPIPLALDASPTPAWDDKMVEYPELDVVNGGWRLWFCGNGFGSVGFAEGVVEARVDISLRSGHSPVPSADWTEWVPVERDIPAPVRRYVQVQARLRTESLAYGPVLHSITVSPAAKCG